MRQYETTMVIDSFMKQDDLQAVATKMQNFIKNNGGTIDQVEEWGKKRLAYEINRKQYGNYIHILFTSESSLPELLEREYRLEESILRYLTVLADPRALEEKAKSATPKEAVAATPEPEAKESITTEASPAPATSEVVEETSKAEKEEAAPAQE